ncbi:MAG: ATP-dependent Clp protease adaptor ClpS [Deltaproteobacteria bacterium]
MTFEDTRTAGDLAEKTEIMEPPRFKVLLHNDDYTTMDFVVHILEEIFQKSPPEAYRIMMHVHEHGVGECGIYTKEIAEAKVSRVHAKARKAGFPLRASMEKE